MTEVVSASESKDPRSIDVDDSSANDRVVLSSVGSVPVDGTDEFPDLFSIDSSVLKSYDGVSSATKQRISRQVRKAYDGKNGSSSNQIESPSGDGYTMFGVVTPPYNIDYIARIYVISSAHYAAVNAKTANIVGLGYDLVDSHLARMRMEESDSIESLQKMQNKMSKIRNELFEWIEDCNDELTFDEVIKNVYIDYEATGNGYFEIGRDLSGNIGYIGHIPAKTMRVRRNRDGYVQIVENKVRFFKHFGKDTADPISNNGEVPNEVIHIKKYSPEQGFYGVPDIIAAMAAVTGNEFASRYNLDYFENKAVPRYVVVIKGGKIGAQGQKELLRFFDSAVKGTNHRTVIVPLPADDSTNGKTSFEMKAIEAGVQDASFVNYHKINIQSILMAEKTPITKVGLAEGVNLAVARDADKTFKENVCRPEQRILDKKLGMIFKEKTNLLRFKINELTITDEDTQSKIDERYLRMQSILPNEVRARWGKPGIDGGDKPVDIKAQAGAEAAAKGNRTRDSQRSAGATDSAGEGRSAKGEGRGTP